jgi:hypothetical protein
MISGFRLDCSDRGIIKELIDAIAERQESEGDFKQHQDRDGGGQTAEASGRHRLESSETHGEGT